MSIEKLNGKMISWGDLVDKSKDKEVIIPLWQRNYRWSKEEATKLFNDLVNAMKNAPEKVYTAGIVTIWNNNDDIDKRGLYIVDGQQRVITTMLIMKHIMISLKKTPDEMKSYRISNITFERDGEATKRRDALLGDEEKWDSESVDVCRMEQNYANIINLIKYSPDYSNEVLQALADFIREKLVFLCRVITTEPLDEFIQINDKKSPFNTADRLRTRMLISATQSDNPTENTRDVIRLFKGLANLVYSKNVIEVSGKEKESSKLDAILKYRYEDSKDVDKKYGTKGYEFEDEMAFLKKLYCWGSQLAWENQHSMNVLKAIVKTAQYPDLFKLLSENNDVADVLDDNFSLLRFSENLLGEEIVYSASSWEDGVVDIRKFLEATEAVRKEELAELMKTEINLSESSEVSNKGERQLCNNLRSLYESVGDEGRIVIPYLQRDYVMGGKENYVLRFMREAITDKFYHALHLQVKEALKGNIDPFSKVVCKTIDFFVGKYYSTPFSSVNSAEKHRDAYLRFYNIINDKNLLDQVICDLQKADLRTEHGQDLMRTNYNFYLEIDKALYFEGCPYALNLEDRVIVPEKLKNSNLNCVITRSHGNDLCIYDGQQRIVTLSVLAAMILSIDESKAQKDNSAPYYDKNTREKVRSLLRKLHFEGRKEVNECLEILLESGINVSDKIEKIKEKICDTATYSIVALCDKYFTYCSRYYNYNSLQKELSFTLDYILDKVTFSEIHLEAASPAEQLFLEINDGHKLEPCEITKANLIHNTRIIDEELSRKLALWLDNEGIDRYYNSSNDPENEEMKYVEYVFRHVICEKTRQLPESGNWVDKVTEIGKDGLERAFDILDSNLERSEKLNYTNPDFEQWYIVSGMDKKEPVRADNCIALSVEITKRLFKLFAVKEGTDPSVYSEIIFRIGEYCTTGCLHPGDLPQKFDDKTTESVADKFTRLCHSLIDKTENDDSIFDRIIINGRLPMYENLANYDEKFDYSYTIAQGSADITVGIASTTEKSSSITEVLAKDELIKSLEWILCAQKTISLTWNLKDYPIDNSNSIYSAPKKLSEEYIKLLLDNKIIEPCSNNNIFCIRGINFTADSCYVTTPTFTRQDYNDVNSTMEPDTIRRFVSGYKNTYNPSERQQLISLEDKLNNYTKQIAGCAPWTDAEKFSCLTFIRDHADPEQLRDFAESGTFSATINAALLKELWNLRSADVPKFDSALVNLGIKRGLIYNENGVNKLIEDEKLCDTNDEELYSYLKNMSISNENIEQTRFNFVAVSLLRGKYADAVQMYYKSPLSDDTFEKYVNGLSEMYEPVINQISLIHCSAGIKGLSDNIMYYKYLKNAIENIDKMPSVLSTIIKNEIIQHEWISPLLEKLDKKQT